VPYPIFDIVNKGEMSRWLRLLGLLRQFWKLKRTKLTNDSRI
jgi:hypothetical protein